MIERFKKLKQKIITWAGQHPQVLRLIAVVMAVGLLGWLGFTMFRSDNRLNRTDPVTEGSNAPVIEFVDSPLTGEKISPDVAKRAVLAVQIENSPDARPQSGLSQAGVVFEAIAEAGITRFSAYYLETEPAKLGPIRSLRPYYIDWALGFDAAIANTGASDGAQRAISQFSVKNINDTFYRASDRFAPHNAYSSYKDLYGALERKGYTSHNFTPLKRKSPKPLETPKAASIDINISSSTYNVAFNYNGQCNCYLRNMAGTKHIDRENGQQISPDVVVVMKMAHSILDPRDGNLALATIGSGEALIFQDGNVTKATWRKAGRDKQITFINSKDEAIGLNPGQTWFTVIPPANSVIYSQ